MTKEFKGLYHDKVVGYMVLGMTKRIKGGYHD